MYRHLSFERVKIEGGFWGTRLERNRTVTMPIEYAHLKKTGRIDIWTMTWRPGDPNPPHIYWDSDVAKWMEAAAYSLAACPDPELEQKLDTLIARMEQAQQADGYLNSYYSLVEPEKRWSNLRQGHELYCAGHLMEAAVAHYRATGKRTFLDVMCRYADHIASVFGPRRGQKRGYPGHQEIELALVKLADVVGEERYLELARYFIDERGRQPHYFDQEARARGEDPADYRFGTHAYSQSHIPVREQTEVVGHAVRAMYLYSGMVDVAVATGDKTLLKACRRLWHNVTRQRMHVTGGVGPTASNEGFTTDFDLPTEKAYLETCASIGLLFWAHRLLKVELNGDYGDVMERALYNGILSGVSLEGDHFFYGNPLAAHPGFNASGFQRPDYHYRRSPWFGCACCPTNVVRLLASLGGYIYSAGRAELCVHLYANCKATLEIAGQTVHVQQKTNYPWSEKIRLTLTPDASKTFTVSLRIPGWCRNAALEVNGKSVALAPLVRKGYARIRRHWNPGDRVDLLLPMPVERVVADPRGRQVCGRVAMMRGPVVYCLEAQDNGAELNDIRLPREAPLTCVRDAQLLGGIPVVRATGIRRRRPEKDAGKLYSLDAPRFSKTKLKAIPYALWAHREPGEMLVWIRE